VKFGRGQVGLEMSRAFPIVFEFRLLLVIGYPEKIEVAVVDRAGRNSRAETSSAESRYRKCTLPKLTCYCR